MLNTLFWWGGLTLVAILLDLSLMALLRRYWRTPDSADIVRFRGVFSPILTQLKYHRLPKPAMTMTPIESRSTPSGGLALFGLSVTLAGLGQATLQTESFPPAYGVGLYLAAGILFALTLRQIEPATPPFAPAPLQTPTASPKLAFWLTSLGMSLFAMWGALNHPSSAFEGWLLVAAWLTSMALFVWSVLRLAGWRWPTRAALQTWWRTQWREWLLLAALGGLALTIRMVNLELLPYSFVNDEGEVGVEGLRLLRGERTNLFEVGWASQPLLSFGPSALAVGLWGHTAFAVRMVSALQGALTVMLVYLLGRDWFDRATGLLAAAFLLALPFHVHFSRLGVNNVVDALTSTAILWLTYRALRRGSLTAYVWAGLVTGLALYVYLGSRLAILLAVGTLVYVALRHRPFLRTHLRPLLIFAGAAGLVAAPMAAFFWRHPDHFFARLNAEGILNNGYLQRAAENTGRGYIDILLEQFSRSSLVYVARPAPSGFFNSPAPYLTFTIAIFFVLGIAYTLGRLGEPRYMTLGAWFWSVIILGGTLTIGPPASQRLLMSAPALALLVALGLRKTALVLERAQLVPARVGLVLCAAAVLLADVQGLYFYFGEYQHGHYFEDPSNELTYESGQYTSQLGSDYRMYLLGQPSVYIVFANFRYFAPDLDMEDFNTVTPATLAGLPHDRGAFFLAAPSRRADLEWVAQQLPGGEWIVAQRRYHPTEVLYYAYQLPPRLVAQP